MRMTREHLLIHMDEALRKASTQGRFTPGWYYWVQAARGMERLLDVTPETVSTVP